MGALPKRKISTYRRGKRRASIKLKASQKIQSFESIAQHALKKSTNSPTKDSTADK